MKVNPPIVSAITAVDLPDVPVILLEIHEGIFNATANCSQLSEHQLTEYGIHIESKRHRHGGTQQMIIRKDNK